MPEVSVMEEAAVVFISTEIGRGHPSYLDGLIQTLDSACPDLRYHKSDVFTLSAGISLAAWKAVRRMYRIGGRGGAVSSAYGRLRHATGATQGGGSSLRLLGRDLRRRLASFSGLVVVAHPIVARVLATHHDVIYQHGELAAPPESFVPGCKKILVPLKETAECFMRAGFSDDDLLITGQCIETDLVSGASEAFRKRISRINSDNPLTAALFSSGAYPPRHLAQLRRAAVSLIDAGHSVYLFAGQSQRVASDLERHFKTRFARNTGRDSSHRLHLILARDRIDENRRVAEIFGKLDFFVAPAHERTNWAVGLGLPQIILTPHIGSYAPLNARLALDRDVGVELPVSPDGVSAAALVDDLRRSGRLTTMAENGFGKTAIDGFAHAAGFVAGICAAKK